MNLCSLASGSSGNCIYVSSDSAQILIDAGISKKRIDTELNKIDVNLNDMDGILITHEHSDHICGLGVLSRKHEIPIYATKGTIDAIKKNKTLGDMPVDLFREINLDETFLINDLHINPIKISHDAAEPVAYRVNNNGKSVAIITDLGKYDDYIVDSLKDLDVILLEANHDIKMLQVGKYPYYLKQRILGDKGHLSNEASGRLLCRLLHDNLKKILLGHMSKENNYEELAYETVRLEVDLSETPYKSRDFSIQIAKRDTVSEFITI